MLPPETSWICLTILTQSYSKSAESNGELMESDSARYSGPSNVETLSNIANLLSLIVWVFVLRWSRQNYGDQDTLIIEFF